MKKAHDILFEQKFWKEGFGVMPLDKEVVIEAEKASDLPVIRVRASEYNRYSDTRKISVSIDLDNKIARIIAKKKR